MCDMLIEAFQYPELNNNAKTNLYHAGNIGREAKVCLVAYNLSHILECSSPLNDMLLSFKFCLPAGLLVVTKAVAW